MNDRLLRRRAVDAGIDIFAVGYRLAPEHPFPAGIEDCVDTLSWLATSAAELGIDPDHIGVGGASAGGNLAALVAVHARDHGGPPLNHQVLEAPAVSLRYRLRRIETLTDRSLRHPRDLAELVTALDALRVVEA